MLKLLVPGPHFENWFNPRGQLKQWGKLEDPRVCLHMGVTWGDLKYPHAQFSPPNQLSEDLWGWNRHWNFLSSPGHSSLQPKLQITSQELVAPLTQNL